MKSNIIYINNKEENTYKSSILKLIRDHLLSLSNNRVLLAPSLHYDALLLSKYLIEKNNLDYFKIINGDIDELMTLLKESGLINKIILGSFKSREVYKLLGKIAFEDYRIETYIDRVLDNYIDSNKKYLLISSYPKNYVSYSNIDIYVEERHNEVTNRFKIYDTIIGINRKYYSSIKDIKLNEYDEIVFINDDKSFYLDYRDFRKKILNDTRLYFKKEILMIADYSSISNYKYGSVNPFFRKEEIDEIQKVFIDENKAYILYKYNRILNNNKVNIKELSSIKDEELKKLINDDKEINNISIYVNKEDIINNNYRIGFKAYNNKIDNKRILMLIDRNTSIIKRIRELDEEISVQIDRMIIK